MCQVDIGLVHEPSLFATSRTAGGSGESIDDTDHRCPPQIPVILNEARNTRSFGQISIRFLRTDHSQKQSSFRVGRDNRLKVSILEGERFTIVWGNGFTVATGDVLHLIRLSVNASIASHDLDTTN
jgi:hypothetical protein